MKALAHRQRGVGIVGLIMIAMGIVFVAILGMKLIPAYIHNAQIAQIFKAMSHDPSLQGATVKDIKESYIKRADISYITDIRADDIEIIKGDGMLSVSASYAVKIPLVGNITLVLDFNPSSS
jgi:hypothetical protein